LAGIWPAKASSISKPRCTVGDTRQNPIEILDGDDADENIVESVEAPPSKSIDSIAFETRVERCIVIKRSKQSFI
jgi:hypothetical protein